jgi:creatinine amidohydrolase
MLSIFNTSPEISESNFDTAVFALGSVEPKGPHLPLGLDMMLANRFAHDFCRGKAVYLLPVFPYSTAVETRGFAGAVGLEQQTMWDVLHDVARLLARQSFKRLIILDFSNHNWIVKHAVREINLDNEIIRTVWVNPRRFAREAVGEDLLPDFGGGAVETALAMHLFADAVGEPPEDFDPGVGREHVDYHGLKAIAPRGYWGKPAGATASLGKRLYDFMHEKTAEYLDYALGLFGDSTIGEHSEREIWWPTGDIPGASGNGIDWHSSLDALASANRDLAILPTASTEQHSTCQPLATDYLQCLHLAAGVADRLGAYLLPALPIVTSWGHIRFRGTVTFSAMTARRIIEDVVASLREGGFKKIAVVNVHGGNWVVKPTIIELNHKYPDTTIVTTGDILAYRGQAAVEELHADSAEGSFVKAFYPEAFRGELAVDYTPDCPASAFDLVGIDGVTPKGVWGYPTKADAARGRADLESSIASAANAIRDALAHAKGAPNRK